MPVASVDCFLTNKVQLNLDNTDLRNCLFDRFDY
jgi:hypothetical protein